VTSRAKVREIRSSKFSRKAWLVEQGVGGVGGEGGDRITREKDRTGGTWAIPHILDFLLQTFNHPSVSTPILPLCITRINHLCSFMEQGKVLDNNNI
jgi:hypothetical protein